MRGLITLASAVLFGLSCAMAPPTVVRAASESSPATKKFEQALDRTGNLHLPLNRAYLYRQAASAVAQRDKPEAVLLLKRALFNIDSAEVALRAESVVDDHALQQLEQGRRLAIMQLLRLDSAEAMQLLSTPQTADADLDLQRQVYESVGARNSDVVRDAALRKLDYGVTPAVVAAYDVLRRRDPGTAKLLGATTVFRLETIDPAGDPLAVKSAFALLKLQRGEAGGRDSRMNLSSSLLGADLMKILYTFIGNAFLEAADPQVLVLTEKPADYMQGMQQYAPEKAQEVTQLVLAATSTANGKSPATSQNQPAANPEQSDPQALTADEQKQREEARAQVQARLTTQIKETTAQIRLLSARIGQATLTEKERDDALFAAVDQANRSLSLGRASADSLEPEAFKNGELEFYNFGLLTGVVEAVSSVLQRYALEHPNAAQDAASRLDGPEVQTEVELQVAIREMNPNGGDRFSGDHDELRRQIRDQLKQP